MRDVLGQRLAGDRPIGLIVMLATRGGNNLEIVRQQSIGVEPVKRGQQHPPGEVAGRSEQKQGLDFFGDHAASPSRAGGAVREDYQLPTGA